MTINVSDYPANERYALSDSAKQGNIEYEGRVNKNGTWFIAKEQSGQVRYAAGTSDYDTNWSNRAALTYVYYYELFTA